MRGSEIETVWPWRICLTAVGPHVTTTVVVCLPVPILRIFADFQADFKENI